MVGATLRGRQNLKSVRPEVLEGRLKISLAPSGGEGGGEGAEFLDKPSKSDENRVIAPSLAGAGYTGQYNQWLGLGTMTYAVLKLAHIIGAILIGAGLIGVWLSDMRSRKERLQV